MSKYDDYKNKYPNGSKIDTDGFPREQPFQCFDSVLAYMRIVANNPSLYISCQTSGYVKDWWNDFDRNGLSQWFDRIPWNSTGQRGDIAIWNNAPATPFSHVATIEEDRGNTQLVYGQNQPQPYTTTISLTSNGLLGYLRPKNQTSGGSSNMSLVDDSIKTQLRIVNSEVKGWNRDEVHSGKFDEQEIAAWRGQSVQKFLQQAWEEGEWYRRLKDTWQAAFNEKDGLQNALKKLSDEVINTQTALAQQRSVANDANLKLEEQVKNTVIATSTIESQNQLIEVLKAELEDAKKTTAQPSTGDAGIKPTPPIDWSKLNELIANVGEFVKNLLNKNGGSK